MKIKEIHIGQLTIPLIRPFITAIRQTNCVSDVVIMLKTEEGATAYGSAASTPAITGDSTETIINAIYTILGPQLINQNIADFSVLLKKNNNILEGNTSAKAAIDIALHDLFAQYCSLPLYKLLGGKAGALKSCITISAQDSDAMVQDALDLMAQGHITFKIKLGKDPKTDIQTMRALRKALGTQVNLLIDANQGWSFEESNYIIKTLKQAQLNIQLIEQPLPAANLDALKKISSTAHCAIIADEACFSPQDALTIASSKSCHGVNIKLMKSGGIMNAQAIYNIIDTAGLETMVGCMLESPIGVAAIASFALSKPNIRYADLDPIFLIRENYVQGGVQIKNNKIILSDKPGLGIEGISQGINWLGVIK